MITYFEVLLQTGKIKANGLLVEVAVALHLETGVAEDGRVVTPRRDREVDRLDVGVEATQEGTTDAERTSARDGLRHSDLFIA